MNEKKTDLAPDDDLKIIANARRLTREYFFSDYEDTEKRKKILSELFGSVGENVVIDTPLHCDYGKHTFIGNNVIINMNCTFVDDAKITIGSNVLIASNVQFYTGTHDTDPEKRMNKNWEEEGKQWFNTLCKPITVKDGAWLGGGVIVLPGVTIGENSVIGAGSVVTRSIPDNCVAVGNPCRPIRFLK